MGPGSVFLSVLFVILVFSSFIAIMSRYRKCPSDKIMVVYGKVGRDESGAKSARCIHGGAAFVWPVIQGYQYLDLTPLSIEVNLMNALSNQNIRIDAPSRFTVGIATEEGVMQNAAERLLGLKLEEIQELARDIIFGQLRVVVATMSVEEINSDRDKFLLAVSSNVEDELKKIGLRLINVNVTDISDESGYIKALGKEAAAKAINDAKKSVAEKDRDGSVGEANAQTDQRVKVAEANATAVEGENNAKISIANSDATRRQKEAEALRKATAAEQVQAANALEESYKAEESAEKSRANRERATKEADIVVNAEIERRKIEIDAEAEAEKQRREAKGEADAIYAKMEAQARGINEILTKQAEGFGKIVEAAGGDANAAIKLMLVDKIEDLVKTQVEAIKNLNIDKITVWDSMKDGTPTTANFMSGMLKALPPLHDMFNMAGMDLPEYLGKAKGDEASNLVYENNNTEELNQGETENHI